jgi:hypothetical protein
MFSHPVQRAPKAYKALKVYRGYKVIQDCKAYKVMSVLKVYKDPPVARQALREYKGYKESKVRLDLKALCPSRKKMLLLIMKQLKFNPNQNLNLKRYYP